MNKLSEQYIKKDVQKVCALYNAYKVCESDIELRDVLESRIEELLIELVDELADESNAKEMEEYRKTFETYENENGLKLTYPSARSYDYLNKRRLDFRGLINLGLAIQAPDWMYN